MVYRFDFFLYTLLSLSPIKFLNRNLCISSDCLNPSKIIAASIEVDVLLQFLKHL
jgi:hypothetical protein